MRGASDHDKIIHWQCQWMILIPGYPGALVLFLKPSGVVQNMANAFFSRLNTNRIKLVFHVDQFLVLLLQFMVANQSFINLPVLLLRSLVV